MERIEVFLESAVMVAPPAAGAWVEGFTEEPTNRAAKEQVMFFDAGRDLCHWLTQTEAPGLLLDAETAQELRLTREQVKAIAEADLDETLQLFAAKLLVPQNVETGAPFGHEGFVVVFRDEALAARWQAPDPCRFVSMRGREFLESMLSTDLPGVVVDPDAPEQRWVRREGIEAMLRHARNASAS